MTTFQQGDRVRLISQESKYNPLIVRTIRLGTVGVVEESIPGNPPDAIQVHMDNGYGSIEAKCLEKIDL